MEILSIKQRFGIIGNSPLLDRAIDVARQVAITDLAVLITGESGTGKEFFPKIIHYLSSRKHGPYIAVNCGAIPEGTIDSELFGHEKGAFTGAYESRKGYFEEVNGGTIFLDEISELPLSTQVRLLRVIETGEFLRVGSSKVLKTNVRVIGATNIDIINVINRGKFREDLYYRLSSVPIHIPPLRERKNDIILLFKKFSNDFAQNNNMPAIQLTDDAKDLLMQYRWQGNIRQLKNIAEQISIIEKSRLINPEILKKYIPDTNFSYLPVLYKSPGKHFDEMTERDLLYKIFFDMRNDILELKKTIFFIIEKTGISVNTDKLKTFDINDTFQPVEQSESVEQTINSDDNLTPETEDLYEHEVLSENLSLSDNEKTLIIKALKKNNNNRKKTAKELEISERTLYRKIKFYDIDYKQFHDI